MKVSNNFAAFQTGPESALRPSRVTQPRAAAPDAGRDTYVSGTICSLSGGMLTNKMARLKGFEPPTSSSGGKRSIH